MCLKLMPTRCNSAVTSKPHSRDGPSLASASLYPLDIFLTIGISNAKGSVTGSKAGKSLERGPSGPLPAKSSASNVNLSLHEVLRCINNSSNVYIAVLRSHWMAQSPSGDNGSLHLLTYSGRSMRQKIEWPLGAIGKML